MAHSDASGSPILFTDEEQRLLTDHQIAVYRGKLIFQAQPPITAVQIDELEKMLGAPIPESLLELWNVAYGGELDYNLNVPLGEHAYTASFTELFYPASTGYRDLYGWIENEEELAYDAALEQGLPEPERLRYLPFGGFEYLERLYVDTDPDTVGTVLIWAKGLPPAWTGRLHDDTAATVCGDIPSLFDMIKLDVDPRTADPESYPSGLYSLDAIDRLRPDSEDLAARLEALLVASIFDARGLAIAHEFDGSPKLLEASRLGWMAAGDRNDGTLADVLLAHGYPTDRVISGTLTPVAYAIAQGATTVANRLLDSGRPFGNGAVALVKVTDIGLINRLIEKDIAFQLESVVSAATKGNIDIAVLIANNARRAGTWGDAKEHLLERANRERETADKVEARQMGSYATPEQHRTRADGLEAAANAL